MSIIAAASVLMYELVRKREQLDNISVQLNGEKVFGNISLPLPKLHPPELGLLRVVSWFYVLFNESGRVNLDFLVARFVPYELDPDGSLARHLELCGDLRTYFQHNLDPGKARDKKIQCQCENWFLRSCSTPVPEDEEHWLQCLEAFLQETLRFFSALSGCMRAIEHDESAGEIIRDWQVRRSRYHAPHEFDAIISVVAADIGRGSLDVVKLRNQYYQQWNADLQSLSGEYDFAVEARRLVEYTILTKQSISLPIDGHDIMKSFNLQPGPQVGRMLEKALGIYKNEACDAQTLLERLQATPQ